MPELLLELDDIRGRDGGLPEGSYDASLRYDSVIVNSTGIGAIVFAARMARDPRFAGRVIVAAPPVKETRRLTEGCTLRARTLDYCAYANGTTREAVLAKIYGPDCKQAVTDRQIAALCYPDTDARNATLGPRVTFMQGDDAKPDRTFNQPFAYGVRNSRFMGALNDLAGASGVQFVREPATTFDELRALAKGSRPLIVNGGTKPVEGAAWAFRPEPPKAFVAGSQLAFTAPKREAAGVLGPHDSFVGVVNREGVNGVGALDLCVFYPLLDPLSPNARFYGIFYRAIKDADAADKEREQDILLRQAEGVAAAMGLAPDDPDETLARAFVPVAPWRKLQSRQQGVLDLSYINGGGCPIIAGDGMTRASLGGIAAAEAILRGQPPEPAINRALKLWRQINYVQYLTMTGAPNVSVYAMQKFPKLAFSGFKLQRDWDMWAGAY
ncbi:MAG: hypothetical protein ACOH12_00855 [Parvibaculaceae bacterium]